MTKSQGNNPSSDSTGHSYHGRGSSIATLTRFAEARSKSVPDTIWDAMNARVVRTVQVWRNRLKRQRQHVIMLQDTLTEKNAYILELQAENLEMRGKLDFVAEQIKRYEAV